MGRCHLVAALAAVMLLPAARPGEQVVKPTKNLITGLVDGEGLDQLIPPAHFITEKEDFEKLWKAWLLDCQAPAVDFKTDLVLIATSTEGPIAEPWLAEGPKAGEMTVKVELERKTRPDGFYTLIAVFPREGLKSINGTTVPAE